MRAPGKFVESLRRKAASAGDVEICEFPLPASPKLASAEISRRNHSPNDGILAIAASPPNAIGCLLSSLRASKLTLLNADLVQQRWSGMDRCLQAALRDIPQLANGQPLPSSFGLNRRRQSESPVKVLLNQHETCVAVPPAF